MAKFKIELPDDVLKDIEYIDKRYVHIFGGMVQKGAEIVLNNVKKNMPDGMKNSNIVNTLHLSSVYKTPSDDGINTKVMFNGYFVNENGIETPAPLIANIFEYGRSNAPFPKQPFFRKSFNKKQITKAMLEAQKELSEGILDE